MKRGTPSHKKMFSLADKLEIPLPMAVGILEMLWQFTGESCPEGNLGSVSDSRIAKAVGWEKKKTISKLIEVLVECKWLDKDESHRLIVHDWPDHAEYEVCRKLIRTKKDFLPIYGKSVWDRRAPGAPKHGIGAQKHASREALGLGGNSSSIETTATETTTPEVSTIKKEFYDHDSIQRQKQISDQPFQQFRLEYDFTNRATTDGDWDDAYFAWPKLSFEQKLLALDGIKREAGNSMVFKPRKYLEKKEWERRPSPPPIQQQKKRAIDFI